MPAQLQSKRAWLLLAASITLHIFLFANTRIIGNRTAITPGKRLLRRWSIDDSLPAQSLLELPYSEWYDHIHPTLKPFYIIFLLFVLGFLFSFIGISASDFFCPNLATIASYLGLNESTAGVTFLAFGNGSPDVFSTFSAMKNETVGLAIGELIGAATFITSIVVGSIAFVRPFHVPRHAFMRDVLFFTSAVFLLVLSLRDGHLGLYEAGSMVLLYIAYVLVVVGGNWWARRRRKRSSHDHLASKNQITSKSPLLDGSHRSRRSSTYSSPHLSPIPQPMYIDEEEQGEDEVDDITLNQTPGEMTPVLSSRPNLGRTRSHTSAAYLNPHQHPHLHHHDSIDTPRANFSLLGAIEFRDVVNSLRKESTSRLNSPGRSPGERDRDREQTDYFGPMSAVGHRRSSSYGFSAALASSQQLPRRSTSIKGRRRASTHSSPTGVGESSRSVSTPAPVSNYGSPAHERPNGINGSSEPNPWEDQEGNPPTPQPPAQLTVPTVPKPLRPKVIIPQSEQRVHLSKPSVPSIAVVDPLGNTDIPEEPTPPETPPLQFIKKSESRFAVRRRSKLILRVLFPSLQSFRHKSWMGMILAITSVPAILALTLTLPVVDDGGGEGDGGIALPTSEDEGLNDPELGIAHTDQGRGGYPLSDHGEEAEADDGQGFDESNRLLNPEIGEELHHLVDHGFSPLHSPLGRISHGSLRRLNSRLSDPNLNDAIEDGDGGGEEGHTKEEDLYEEMEEERGLEFNRWLTATQCILGPAFCVLVTFNEQSYFLWVLISSLIGGSLAAIATIYYATDGSSYTWRLVRCFCGFICSMVWIAAIADEVVGVLSTVGEILGLSDAIIGLTIFAVGNSLADLVANVTVAQFAPAMAYAACFGGPMLNLLLGVGGSGTYHILFTPSRTPVTIHFSPTLWVSAGGLILILITTAIFVPLNNYLIDRRWASCLIVIYIVTMVVNVAVEIKTGRS